jgi:hypothetical protein
MITARFKFAKTVTSKTIQNFHCEQPQDAMLNLQQNCVKGDKKCGNY